jgi:small-conductance mechanosensitive channel
MSDDIRPESLNRPGESNAQRYDRNWADILQELRVTLTGNQIITGFLLALAFQQRFSELPPLGVVIYLVLVGLACAATLLALAPVSLHRWLFQRHVKAETVLIGNRILRITLIIVAVLIVGVALFLFYFVVSLAAGIVAASVTGVILIALWVLLPLVVLRRGEAEEASERAG